MKLSIDRADLLRSLSHVQGVVERRNTIPILSNVLLRTEDGALSFATTDMDIEMNESVAANVSKSGATTVPAHTLYDIARKIPDGVIDLELSGQTLTVKAGRSTFKLGCLPTEDFPEMNANDDYAHRFSIPVSDLKTLIDRTRFAISNEETRYYLNGIFVHAVEADGIEVLRAVATDGHRLARFQMTLPQGAEGLKGIIIPKKAVNEIRKLIDEAAADIEVSISDTKMRFAFDHITLTTKLIDGTFPDYERVIPRGNNKILELNPAHFASAVDRVATIMSEKSRAVKMTLKGKTLILSANSPDSGSATEEIEVNFNADSLEIGFNSSYLMDVAKQMESDGCRMTMSDQTSAPTIIQDISDNSSLYILMPMQI